MYINNIEYSIDIENKIAIIDGINTDATQIEIVPTITVDDIIYEVVFPNDCNNLFSKSKAKTIKINKLLHETTNIENMKSMFAYCNIEELDLSNLNTENVTTLTNMFYSCFNLKEINVSSFNTKNVTNMGSMFFYCQISELDLSNFNTENVTDMQCLFSFCGNLKRIILSPYFNTKNVNNMRSMFFDCKKLEEIDLSNFNTENVTSMEFMFFRCTSLKNINILSFSTKNLINAFSAFHDISVDIKQIDLNIFDKKNVISIKNKKHRLIIANYNKSKSMYDINCNNTYT